MTKTRLLCQKERGLKKQRESKRIGLGLGVLLESRVRVRVRVRIRVRIRRNHKEQACP